MRLWNDEPEADESVNWSGACPDGPATGRGVLEWRSGDEVDHYQGDLRQGRFNGQGTYAHARGGRYEGEWRDSIREGHGVMTYTDGRYEGEWRNNKRGGQGVFAANNGFRYDGEWRDDEQSGRGIATWANGSKYEGEWRDGRPDGAGEAVINGETYRGNWAEGCYRDGNRRMALGRPLSECP